MKAEILFTGITELCRMKDTSGRPLAGSEQGSVDILGDAAFAVQGGRVVATGTARELEAQVQADEVVNLGGGVVLPGWVDSHTHLLFGGTREDEFAMRIQGKSYQEISAGGGGIHSSVRHFREASDAEMLSRARKNLDLALALGTTTIEIKSGYGLAADQELRALRLIQELAQDHPVRIIATFLGAHEIPQGRDRKEYISEVTDVMMPQIAEGRLAEFCDVFCEMGVYTQEESRLILESARDHGLKLKIHADEFGETGGSALAAELGAVSADHLHGTSVESAARMAERGVVGVLLPGTSFFLNLQQKAPARDMVEVALPLAVATDMNPGSSMTQSMPLILSLACLQLRLLPGEALVAGTANGACALDRGATLGRIHSGYQADFQVLDLENHRQIPYHYGVSHVREVYRAGKLVFPRLLLPPADSRR